MQRREDVQIENVTFHVPLLGVTKQRRLLFKLLGVVGVPASGLIGDEQKEASGQAVAGMWGALRTAFESLANENTCKVYEEAIKIFRGSQIDGCKVSYEIEGEPACAFLYEDAVYSRVFDQRLDLEFRWVWACLEKNYSGFLERLTKGKLSAVLAKLAQRESGSDPLTESTGS